MPGDRHETAPYPAFVLRAAGEHPGTVSAMATPPAPHGAHAQPDQPGRRGAVHADLHVAEEHLRTLDAALQQLDEHRARATVDRELARQRVDAVRAELARLDALPRETEEPTPGPPGGLELAATGPHERFGPFDAPLLPVPGQLAPSGGGPTPGGPAGAGSARRPVPAAVLLLGVGAVLLLSAAAVFLAFSWGSLGVVGQAGVLAVATVTAATSCVLLRRARLRQGAETFAGVTAGLLLLDLVGARAFNLAGLGAVPADVWTLLSATVLAAAGTWSAVATAAPPTGRPPGRPADEPSEQVRGPGDRPGDGPGDGPPLAAPPARPPLLAGVAVATAAVPVAVAALVVTVAGVTDRLQPADAIVALLVGGLDGFLTAGVVACLIALALPATGPVTVVRATTRVSGLVLLALVALIAVPTAAALPWWWPSADGGSDDVRVVAVRLLIVAVNVGLLAAVPRVLGWNWARVTAAAVAAAVTAGLLVAVGALADLPRDVGLLAAATVIALAALALRRGGTSSDATPTGATVLRRGVTVIVLLLGLIGAGLLTLAAGVSLLAPAADDLPGTRPASAWPASQWLETSRVALTGAATLAVAVLATSSWRLAVGRVSPSPWRGGWRPDVATAAAVAAASVTWWGWAATSTDARLWATSAATAVVLVTTVAAVATRRRLRTYRWGLGPLSLVSLQVLVTAWAVHAVLGTLVAEAAWRSGGLLTGGMLLLAGTGALVLAVAGTRGGPLRPPVLRPGRAFVAGARDATLTTGLALLAAAAAVTAHARPILHGPVTDAVLAALLLSAAAALTLMRLPAWPGARIATAGLGAFAVLVALGGVIGGVIGGVMTTGVELAGPAGALPDRDGLAWLVGALAVAVHAVAVTAPRHGWVPSGTPALRHVLLPGPLLVASAAALACVWPLVWQLPLDVSALPATAVLLTLAGYVAVAAGAAPEGPWAPSAWTRAVGRDVAVPLLLGLAGATLLVTVLPLLDQDVLVPSLLAWAAVPAAVVLTATVALHRADPALAAWLPVARDVVRPLAVAATLLLLLGSARPTTGLPAEVETLLVAAVGLLVHLVREALRSNVLGRTPVPSVSAGETPTLRDATAVVTAAGLGALGVLAALMGERPLWVAGLTWWLLGVSALAVVVLAPGPLAGPRPDLARSRSWWALRVGAGAAVLGWLLAAVDLDWPLERLTVPVGLVLSLFGLAALRASSRGDGEPGTVRLLGPGLLLAVVPSTVLAVVDPTAPRPLAMAVLGSLLVAVGAWRRWRAPLLVGALVVVPVAVVQALPFVVSVPQWVYLAAAGALALAVGVTFERAKQQAQAAGRRWSELR